MSNERWNSQFPHTIPYNLFKRHFTEINQIYWAFVPASNTIKSYAKEKSQNDADPKKIFLIHDDDDRRIAGTYEKWKKDYAEYSNYTRINIIMLLSSCLETYLRTVISLAFESKPGVIIHCPDSVDGVKLLISNPSYGNYNDNSYQFTDQIDDICIGEWSKRIMNIEKYFGQLPIEITEMTTDLDQFRILRNNIAHYFGRNKREYEAPLMLESKPATRVSHERVMKMLGLVHQFASKLDDYLRINYIGSYDIIKFFYQHYYSGKIIIPENGSKGMAMKHYLADNGYQINKSDFFENLANYCGFPDISNTKMYGKQESIKRLHQIFTEREKQVRKLIYRKEFNKYINDFNCKSDKSLCIRNIATDNSNEYLYSEELLQKMADYFIDKYPVKKKNRQNIINHLSFKL